MDFIAGEQPVHKMTFPSTNVTANVLCIIASLEKKCL